MAGERRFADEDKEGKIILQNNLSSYKQKWLNRLHLTKGKAFLYVLLFRQNSVNFDLSQTCFHMKYTLFLLLCSLCSYGQQKTSFGPLPVYYIDSVKMTNLPVFDPARIASIGVIKVGNDTAKRYNDVYITLKEPHDFQFLTLEQIARKRVPAGTLCLFMIDNEIIKDVTGVTIDSSYILKYELMNTKDFTYLQAMPPLAILHIKLKTTVNLKDDQKEYLRGIKAASFQFSMQ